MSTNDELNFNTAEEQRSIDLLPANTIVTLQITVRSGRAGEDGWLTTAKNGKSENLNCEFTVVDGDYAKRKLWQSFTLHGKAPGHEEAARISRTTLRAILESARGIKPEDNSEEAKKAREISSYGDFDGLRFVALIGVKPPDNGYAAKNTIIKVITPDRQQWTKPELVQSSPNPATGAPTPTSPPANAITRPEWAKE
jgi:hypothetical protein